MRRMRRARTNGCCIYRFATACSGTGSGEEVTDLGARASDGKAQCQCKGKQNRDSICTIYDKCEHANVPDADRVCCDNYCKESPSGCFASDTTFLLDSGASVMAHEINKGDRVMSVDGKGNTVFTAVTAVAPAPAQNVFDIAVRTAKGQVAHLGLTHAHMMPAGGQLKLASQVVVGDQVQVVLDGEKQAQDAIVQAVSMKEMTPTHHITTMNHYVVANGVVSSVRTVDEQFGAAMSYLNGALYALPEPVFETVEWLVYTFALDTWQGLVSRVF